MRSIFASNGVSKAAGGDERIMKYDDAHLVRVGGWGPMRGFFFFPDDFFLMMCELLSLRWSM